MTGKNDIQFSISDLLSGHLSALFGVDFGLYLSSPKLYQKRKSALTSQENFTFEQQKIINLLQVMEWAYAERKLENVKKYGLLLVAVLKDLFHDSEIPKKYRQTFFSGIVYHMFSRLGDNLLNLGLAKEALVFYEELFSSHAKDKDLLKKMAKAYYFSGLPHLPQAERIYRQMIRSDPEDLDNYEALGRLLEKSPGREEESFLVYRDALRHCRTDMDRISFYIRQLALFPQDYNLLLRLGRLYRRQGMFLESRHYFEKAFELQPDVWTALDLGRLCCMLNDLRRAKEIATAMNGNKKSFSPACYLSGLINEEEAKWNEARNNYTNIPPGTLLYWEAKAGIARTFLQEGKFLDAEKTVKEIPVEKRNILGAEYGTEYLELCEMLEKNVEEKSFSSSWREYLRDTEPQYELKKDIRRRNMGTAFWRKYEFLEVYENGPAGQVLLGRDRNRGHRIAIKKIDKKFTTDPVIIRRLQGFLHTLRSFSSPRIVSIYEDCYHNGRFFFAMEYMAGGSLAKYIRRSPLPLTDAFAIVLQVCSALEHFYKGGKGGGAFSHGALKPENVLFSADGNVKISGFDIPWILEGSKAFTGAVLKKYSSFWGTFIYAAPERFAGGGFWGGRRKIRNRGDTLEAAVQGIDHRADLYSLGVILFELLTGTLPFKKQNIQAAARFHRSSKPWPSPRFYNPALPEDPEAIVLKLLSRDPHNRYATPLELKKAIKEAKIV
ncbi:MAG: serine/threonine protein kinase [Firmicutes bacterium]|nr:serine/threonine protein kinase [Bacillota bacterium]